MRMAGLISRFGRASSQSSARSYVGSAESQREIRNVQNCAHPVLHAAEEDAKTVKHEEVMEESPALDEEDAAEFEDSESDHDSGNESDAVSEEYQRGASDDVARSSTPRRSQRKRRPARQLLQDSDDDEDDSPVGVSLVLGKDSFAAAAEADPDVPSWPAVVRRRRSARSGTSGGSSTPPGCHTMSQ